MRSWLQANSRKIPRSAVMQVVTTKSVVTSSEIVDAMACSIIGRSTRVPTLRRAAKAGVGPQSHARIAFGFKRKRSFLTNTVRICRQKMRKMRDKFRETTKEPEPADGPAGRRNAKRGARAPLFGPWRKRAASALGELERATGLCAPILLALDHTR